MDGMFWRSELSTVEQVEKLGFELKGKALYGEILSGIKVEVKIPRADEIITPLIAKRIGCRCRKALRIEPLCSGLRGRASSVRDPFSPLRTSARIGHVAPSHCAESRSGVVSNNPPYIP